MGVQNPKKVSKKFEIPYEMNSEISYNPYFCVCIEATRKMHDFTNQIR